MVIHCFGNPQPLFSKGPTLSEHPQLRMAPDKPGTGTHSGRDNITKAFTAPCPVEERHGLLVIVNRSTIITPGMGG